MMFSCRRQYFAGHGQRWFESSLDRRGDGLGKKLCAPFPLRTIGDDYISMTTPIRGNFAHFVRAF